MEYYEGYFFEDGEEYTEIAEFCNKNPQFYIDSVIGSDLNRYFILKKRQPPTQAELLEQFKTDIINSVQAILDEKAAEKGYDNGFALASYAMSTDAIFKNEAEKYIKWRDLCWRYLYNLLDDFMTGKIGMQTKDEIIANMPGLEW